MKSMLAKISNVFFLIEGFKIFAVFQHILIEPVFLYISSGNEENGGSEDHRCNY